MEKEDWKTLKILNVKTEDFQILKSEDLVTKPAKPEEWRYEFLTGKIQLLIQALLTEKTQLLVIPPPAFFVNIT